MTRTKLVVLTAVLLIAGGFVAHLRSQPAPRPAAIQLVKPDLYMIAGEGGNVAVYVTGEGVVLVDDMYERNYAAVIEQVRSVTDRPIRYVLNTHHHDDHAGGNVGAVRDRLAVVAHRNVRKNMSRLNQPGLPDITFATETSIFLGGREVRAAHYGRGHTDGDAVIHFPAERVIHTGDLFLARRPGSTGLNLYFDYANGGSANEWISVMDRILALDFDTVIPGHGAVSSRQDVERWRADLIELRDRIRGMVRQGQGKDDIVAVLVERYGWPKGGLAIQQVDALIAELRN